MNCPVARNVVATGAENEVVNCHGISSTVPVDRKYILTNKGLDLVPILDSLCSWGKLYADGKEISVPIDK